MKSTLRGRTSCCYSRNFEKVGNDAQKLVLWYNDVEKAGHESSMPGSMLRHILLHLIHIVTFVVAIFSYCSLGPRMLIVKELLCWRVQQRWFLGLGYYKVPIKNRRVA